MIQLIQSKQKIRREGSFMKKYLISLLLGSLFTNSVLAAETVPITFKEGDVISAEVMNEIMSRINNVTTGFQNSAELDGDWMCTTYDTQGSYSGEPVCVLDTESLLYSKTGLLTFDSKEKTFSYKTDIVNDNVFYCGTDIHRANGNYSVKNNYLILNFPNGLTGLHKITKTSPDTMSFPGSGEVFINCKKNNTVPNPVDNLTAVIQDNAVLVSWVDKSSNELSFKVERKADGEDNWSLVSTVASNTESYIDNPSSGTYQYRVIATNEAGDSFSSSIVEVVLNEN